MVDATPEQGHGECHANPAQHQDMGHHDGPAWSETALHDQGQGQLTSPAQLQGAHLGNAGPGERGSGHSHRRTVCSETRGTRMLPVLPVRTQGCSPAAQSVPGTRPETCGCISTMNYSVPGGTPRRSSYILQRVDTHGATHTYTRRHTRTATRTPPQPHTWPRSRAQPSRRDAPGDTRGATSKHPLSEKHQQPSQTHRCQGTHRHANTPRTQTQPHTLPRQRGHTQRCAGSEPRLSPAPAGHTRCTHTQMRPALPGRKPCPNPREHRARLPRVKSCCWV